MISIRAEMIAFVTAIVSGIIVRMCYQGLSCFRKIVKHTLLLIEIEDIVFWIGCAIYLFVQIYYTSDGIIRWYYVLGVVIGVLFSTLFWQKIKKMTKKICDFHFGKNVAEKKKKRYYNKY